jgi:hypothetical protein
VYSLQPVEHPVYLFSGKNNGNTFRDMGPSVRPDLMQGLLQDGSVEEEKCVECLVLSGCRHVTFFGKKGEVMSYFGLSHILRVTF